MQRTLFLTMALLLSLAGYGQNTAIGEHAASPTATLHAGTRLVIVDVTVTDKHGQPVHELKQGEFTLLEDKKPQSVSSFEEHRGEPGVGTAPPAAAQLPLGVFSNEAPDQPRGPMNILLLDTLNTATKDQAFVLNQLAEYVEKAKPGVRIAIFGLNSRLILLQDLTTDPAVLKRAVEQSRNIQTSPLLPGPVTGNDSTVKLSEELRRTGNASVEAIARVNAFEKGQEVLSTQARAQYTLAAMSQLARYLGRVQGRKNLLWFSGSFPVVTQPDTTLLMTRVRGVDPFTTQSSSTDEFRQCIALLSAAQVAVYPIYAPGSATPAVFDVERNVRNPIRVDEAQRDSFRQTADDHSTMLQMAEQTGGEAFVNTNGLSAAVEKAIGKGSDYYSLSYTPSNHLWAGEYRSIKVALKQQGYTLAYRRGYYADDPEKPAAKAAGAKGAPSPAGSAIQTAMLYGAPTATQIPLKVRVVPVSRAEEQMVAPGNTPNPDAQINKPPYRRYAVDYLADASAIDFERAGNGYSGEVEVISCVYDLEGRRLNLMTNTMALNLTREQYVMVQQRGLPYHQEISAPEKSESLLRIAVHDLKRDSIGSLDVPLRMVRELPPLSGSDEGAKH